MDFRFEILLEYREAFLHGLWMSLQVSVWGILGGLVLGLILGLSRQIKSTESKKDFVFKLFLRGPSLGYITFFRGTPLFVQIFLVHFALMPLLVHPDSGWLISGELARVIKQEYGAFLSGTLALILNSAAYVAEIFRAGLQSLDSGQEEAARSLGMGYGPTMRYVLLPQVFKKMLPPLGNEAIMLLKDSSLVSAIGLAELAQTARTIAGTYSRYWEPYIAVSIIYLVLTMGLAYLVSRLEKHYEKSDRS
ncbi:MAG TPA: amino acid ABC transporter permease [Pseudobdellovibrionaceae bacterium]|nr:amino acid ABC transporter permease [Pseudobdellovibrionaceae bacterium]